jgi:DNA-binding IclR family transcriptional regulator
MKFFCLTPPQEAAKLKSMNDLSGGVHRTVALLRLLATADESGLRLKDIADSVGLPRPTVHRILASLIAEGMVERNDAAKSYRLALDLFVLAARAGNPMNLRELCRPVLLRLAGSLGETIFLLVRSGFDAVCIDRTAGLLPIRSFTRDIGGSVMLGIGQGSMAILAHLTKAEQDEVIRYNLPRMREFSGFDEAFLRAEIARVRGLGFSDGAQGLIPGMAGLGVPIFTPDRRAVAALSVGSTTDRMTPERNAVIAEMLLTEARLIGAKLNPFDPTLRRAGAAMEIAAG